jgi:hypothetical protein
MVDVPAVNPDTKPEPDTVATVVLDESQGLTTAGEADPVSWVVEPTHTVCVPVIVGGALIVTVDEQVAVVPQTSVAVQVMVCVPTVNRALFREFPEVGVTPAVAE